MEKAVQKGESVIHLQKHHPSDGAFYIAGIVLHIIKKYDKKLENCDVKTSEA